MAVSVIPDEYSHIYSAIPSKEKESFAHSLRSGSTDEHRYISIVKAIEKTISVYTNPSDYWFLLYGRIAFVSTLYDELEEFYEKIKETKGYILAPFLGRIKAFQNSYDEAIELSKSTLERIQLEEPKLLDVVLLFEAKFTLGLSYAYTRQFDLANETIADLEEASGKFFYKKLIGEDHILDYVFIENIIKGYTLFFSGKPQEMSDVLNTMREWTINLVDPWLQGFYYNIYGISKIMFNELSEGERALRVAFQKFEEVHDLRGYATVGGNLGMSLLTKGKRIEGRQYLEAVIGPQISMKNYWLAMGNSLEVAKSLLEEKKEQEALKVLQRAEEISVEHNIGDPNTYSMFSFFYSRVGELEKAEMFLEKLREIKESSEDDNYAELFYYMASAINSMHKGDLFNSNADIIKGIEIADTQNYFNYALELSIFHLEIILKRYLVEQKTEFVLKGLEVVSDLKPLIEMTDNPFYETLFYLLAAYLFLAVENYSEASENFDMAQEIALDNEETAQYQEISLYEERRKFITRSRSEDDLANSLFDEFVNNWMSEEYLPVFYTLEAKRLLQNLQFEKTSLEQKKEDDYLPKLLFIVGMGGITVYTHRFDDDESIDEVLVGGFLSALTTFSQELFGGGMLTRIDQENHVLLMEKISDENILVMIVDKETYLLRKKFKQFSTELAKSKLVEYLNTDQVLSEFDPQFQILEGIVEIVFHSDMEETGTTLSVTESGDHDNGEAEEEEETEAHDSPAEIEVGSEVEKTSVSDEEDITDPVPTVGKQQSEGSDTDGDTEVEVQEDESEPEDPEEGDVSGDPRSIPDGSHQEEDYVPSFMRYENED